MRPSASPVTLRPNAALRVLGLSGLNDGFPSRIREAKGNNAEQLLGATSLHCQLSYVSPLVSLTGTFRVPLIY